MKQLLSRYKWHILFWGIYFLFWTLFSVFHYGNTPGKALFLTTAWFLGQAGSGYATIYWLIPGYLTRKRYFLFGFLLLIILVLSALLILSAILVVYRTGHTPLPNGPWKEFFYLLSGNCYTTFFIVALKSIKDRRNADKRTALLEKEKTETELRFLKSQVNPHFLFNAINSIYVLIKKDPEFAGHTLVKFADMLRYQLYECNADKIPIEKEIGYLDNYIELEKLRKGSLLTTNYTVGANTGNFSIAPLLLIPFVENAFKYVSACPEKYNYVTVDLSYQDGIFEISVENSIDEDSMTPREKAWGGIGLENVRRRLELIYKGMYALDISAREDVYSVLLTIKVCA